MVILEDICTLTSLPHLWQVSKSRFPLLFCPLIQVCGLVLAKTNVASTLFVAGVDGLQAEVEP